MKEKISPVGLKGSEITDRIKQLMGTTPINENRNTSVIELTKIGPDGNIYGVIRENHEYYIKITNKKNNLIPEDFSYIGGLKNKRLEVYPSYAKAIKHLNLKFNSLNEAYGKSGQINIFATDGYGLNEMGCSCSEPQDMEPYNAVTAANNEFESPIDGMYSSDEWVDAQQNEFGGEDELDEINQAVQDMMEGDKPKKIVEHKLSINRALSDMDTIIDSVTKPNKKKVYTIK